MKKILSLVLTVVLIFSIFALTSCSTSKNKLSKSEKEIFDILIQKIENNFKNPSSVRVLEIFKIGELDDGNVYASIKLQGKNAFGGIVTETYYLTSEATGRYRFIESGIYLLEFANAKFEGDDDFPVYEYLFDDASSDIIPDKEIEKRFNDAILEYWDKKGLAS